MRRAVVLGAIVGVGVASIALAGFQSAAQGPSPQAIEATRIEKVRDNLYMITGSTPMPRDTFSGGNTGVFVTSNGVIIVDTKLAGWGQVLLDRIKTVTDKPVTMIINTHVHPDHNGREPACSGVDGDGRAGSGEEPHPDGVQNQHRSVHLDHHLG